MLTAKPEANEEHTRGWNVVTYSYNGLVCHLRVVGNGLELAFYRGKELHDPHNITQKKGKKRRSATFHNVSDVH